MEIYKDFTKGKNPSEIIVDKNVFTRLSKTSYTVEQNIFRRIKKT